MADDDDLRNEIASLQHKANELTDKSLASTDRMVNYVYEARDAAVDSAGMLAEQREQLGRIQCGMNDISEDMDQIDVDIIELEKCCGLCVCPWDRVKKVQTKIKTKERAHVVRSQPTQTPSTEQSIQQDGGRFFEPITGDAREEQMEENLTQIANVLGELKPIANDIGNELSSQNTMLEDINVDAQANRDKILSAHERLDRVDKKM